MRYGLLLITVSSALLAQSSGDIVISQIYGGGGNSGAPLRNDYIELFNRSKSAVDVSGWSVQYASATGTSWQITPISGTIQPGRYYLVQQAVGANETAPALPTADAVGTIAMSASSGQVAVVRSTQALPADRSTATDYVQYSNLGNTTAAIRRNGGCLDTDSFSDFTIGQPSPRNSQSQIAAACDAPVEPPLTLSISQVQGGGARSPVENRRVAVRGVVTGKRSNGFWIQSLPADQDTDPATSEGLWVYFAMSPPGTVDRGYLVRVTGTVSEYTPASDPGSLSLTELVEPEFEVVSTGQSLPAPVVLEAGGDWERYEGMRVSVPELRSVSGTLGSYSAVSGTAQSNGVFFGVLPGQPRPYGAPDTSNTGQVIRVDTRAQGAPALDVTTGATVRNLIGPLDYAFRAYTVAQDASEMVTATGGMNVSPVPEADAREFTVASMNLQQFYDDRDDPGGDTVVAAPALQARVTRVGRMIRDILRSPDLIGVQEAENAAVLTQIAAAAGDYDAHLLEGDDPSGIDVGLLTKRGRVTVQNVVQEGKGATLGTDLLWDRPPLVAKVTVEGVPLTAVVVHLRSLLNADTATVTAKRQAQAQFLGNLVQMRAAAGEQVVVLGDFNTYNFDPLLNTVRGTALLNLSDTVPASDNYSYVYNGEAQSIDHIMIGQGLRQRFTRYVVAHVNADYPEVWRGDATQSGRISDHDIPVAYFTLAPESINISAAGVVNAASFLGGAVAPLEIVTIFGRGIGPDTLVSFDPAALGSSLGGTRVLFDGVPADLIYASSGQVSAIVPLQVGRRAMTVMQVEYGGRSTNAVMLPVAPAAPGIFTLSRNGLGQGAILNQDYTVNGLQAAAPRGSVVMIYATGGGTLQPTAGDVPARLTQPVSVRIGGREAVILYAGQAPGLVPGAVQINAQIPADAPSGSSVPVVVTIGDRTAAFTTTLTVQ